jgi:protein-tyrosine phosphatase
MEGIMKSKKCLLLVCTGNTDRSPMAAAIAKHWNSNLEVVSRGIAASRGEPISGIAATALKFGGIPVGPHSSAPITAADVTKADVILTMTLEQKQFVTRKFAQAKGKTFLLSKNGDIADPALWDLRVYRELLDDIAVALAPWLSKLEKNVDFGHRQ